MSRRTFVRAAAGSGAVVAAAKASSAFAAPAFLQSGGSPIEISWWSAFGGEAGEVAGQVVDKFNESQSDIKVNILPMGNYGELAAALTAAIQTGDVPEVVTVSELWWFPFYLSQTLHPLDDLLAADSVDTDDFIQLYTEYNRNGYQWVLPAARSTPLLYYNRDAFAEAGLEDRGPKTWSEMAEWAPSLVKKSDDRVDRHAFSHSASGSSWFFQCTLWAFGGSFSDEEFKILVTEDEAIAAGDMYRSSVVDGWAVAVQDHRQEFITGNAAMTIHSTGSVKPIEEQSDFSVGTAFLPEEKEFGCATGGAGLALMAGLEQERIDAGFAFMNFATSTDISAFWSQNTGYMPVRTSTIESEGMQEFLANNPNFQTAIEQLPETRAQDYARRFIPSGEMITNQGIEQVLINQVETRSAFEEMKSRLEEDRGPVMERLAEIES
jgi:sn-glycerol 3-phosphate transport system substrate-binding protein